MKHRQTTAGVRAADRVYVLTPLLHCAKCGDQMRGKKSRGRSFYSHQAKGCGRGNCDAPAELIENKLLEGLQDLEIPEKWIPEIRKAELERLARSEEPEQRQATRILANLRGSLDRLRDVYILSDITQDEFQARREHTIAEIRRIEAGLSPSAYYDVEETLRRVQEIGKLLSDADSVAQKKALGMILSRIEMWKNEIGQWEVQLAVREEFAELFGDMQTLVVYECPQGNSNPCRSLERAVS